MDFPNPIGFSVFIWTLEKPLFTGWKRGFFTNGVSVFWPQFFTVMTSEYTRAICLTPQNTILELSYAKKSTPVSIHVAELNQRKDVKMVLRLENKRDIPFQIQNFWKLYNRYA
jgi:hypothetical protein